MSLLVRCELDQTAATGTGLVDRPLEHGSAEPATTVPGVDAYGLDGHALSPLERQGRNEGELDGSYNRAIELSDGKKVSRVGVDSVASPPV
jgi:hypothetical protein